MKMKTVTIHYHDGRKQAIRVPETTRYIEQTPNLGKFYAHDKRPRVTGPGGSTYFGGTFVEYCRDGHEPAEDGIYKSILLKIEEV